MRAFISTKDGNCYYRTRLLTLARAHSFCACLQANRRFKCVSVVESTHTAEMYFVQYQPSNQSRYADLYFEQYRQRELKGQTEGRCYDFHLHEVGGNLFYLCASTSGETYEVTPESCSCPDYQYRGKKSGIPCKHIQAYHKQVAIGEIKSLSLLRIERAQVLRAVISVGRAGDYVRQNASVYFP